MVSMQMAEFSRLAANILRIANDKDCVCRKLSNGMNAWVLGTSLALPPADGELLREVWNMAAITVNQRLAGFQQIREQTETVAADRIAQNSMLSELPGAAFAFLTLAYIVLSFVGL